MEIITFINVLFLLFFAIFASIYVDVYHIEKMNDRETNVDVIEFGRVILPRKEI